MTVTIISEVLSATLDQQLGLVALRGAQARYLLGDAALFCALGVAGQSARVAAVERVAPGEIVARWQDAAGGFILFDQGPACADTALLHGPL